MKIVQIGFLILLATGLSNTAQAKQYAPPISKRATATHKPVATGKVITLPATRLPADAVVPPQKRGTTPAIAAASSPVSKPKPAAQPVDPWRFYSYP